MEERTMADTLNPGPYEYPADPGDYKYDAVVAYLKGDDVTPDQWDAVLKAESEGKARTEILKLADSTAPTGPSPSETGTPNSDPAPGTTEPGGVPAEQPPAPQQPDDNPDNIPPADPNAPTSADPEPEENPELALQRSSKPVWYTETQGPVPDDKADLYQVVEPQKVGVA
jgi:hypothetical protein